ncbi:unnamed protein product [Penicillium pancosmium]
MPLFKYFISTLRYCNALHRTSHVIALCRQVTWIHPPPPGQPTNQSSDNPTTLPSDSTASTTNSTSTSNLNPYEAHQPGTDSPSRSRPRHIHTTSAHHLPGQPSKMPTPESAAFLAKKPTVAPTYEGVDFEDNVAVHNARDAIIREQWVRSMMSRLVGEELGKCYAREGVNHFEKCGVLREKYFELLNERKIKGYLFQEKNSYPGNTAKSS